MSVYEISILAIGLNTLINYCIGKPGGEFSPYEIFSNYTVWLSIRRLKKVGLWQGLAKQYNEKFIDLSMKNNKYDNKLVVLENDFNKMLYNEAEQYFTWERMAGMCPVCTGFWVSLVTGLCFTQNIVSLLLIILISHLGIRIINKII